MAEAPEYTAKHVQGAEAHGPQDVLDVIPERVEKVHVAQEMDGAAMHEHGRHDRPRDVVRGAVGLERGRTPGLALAHRAAFARATQGRKPACWPRSVPRSPWGIAGPDGGPRRGGR